MKIKSVRLHNFRSVLDGKFDLQDYTLLVGANNAGKSTVMSAIRIFYENLKWSADDLPKLGGDYKESWIELSFSLSANEAEQIAEKYRNRENVLTIRKVLKSAEREAKSNQSNLYAVIEGTLDTDLFYGAKNVSSAKLGDIIYIPALSVPDDQLKTSGQSPLRDILNLVLKRAAVKSEKYKALLTALDEFSGEANQPGGFLRQLSEPLNTSLKDWGVKLDLSLRQLAPEDVTKNLVQPSFKDSQIGDAQVALERIGHGFQRSLIYELLRLVPKFSGTEKDTKKKEYNPDFCLVLFEEPEAFLHPHQQETLAMNLRKLGKSEGQQVLITTHSPIFAGRAADDLRSIVRLTKSKGATAIHQVDKEELQALLGEGLGLANCLKAFVDDPTVDESHKKHARTMIANLPSEEIALQNETFLFQLWLDSERSSMFFAERVIIVEGATEKCLLDYLLQTTWSDLHDRRIYVVNALGKFNVHRYMKLMEAFGIKHAVLIDGDQKPHQDAVNKFLETRVNRFTATKPFKFPIDLENFLGLPKPDRDDRKPLEMLKAVSASRIAPEKLAELRCVIERDCLAN